MKTVLASYVLSGLLIQNVINFSCIMGQNSSLKWRDCNKMSGSKKKKKSESLCIFQVFQRAKGMIIKAT